MAVRRSFCGGSSDGAAKPFMIEKNTAGSESESDYVSGGTTGGGEGSVLGQIARTHSFGE